MARLFLTSGQTFNQVGAGSPATEVFGTNANETVVVAADGDAIFDASFNRGGDTIIIGGSAASYTASISGSNLVLTSAAGANIVIPYGDAGVSIKFADATARTLVFNTTTNQLVLGSQTIATTGTTAVTPGTIIDPTPTNEVLLTPNQDILTGTSGNNLFLADIVQVNGLQVNTLGTGDNVNGGAGTDRLTAQIYRAATFDGTGGLGVNGGSNAPIQPRLNSVEQVLLEAQNSDLATKPLPYNVSAVDLTPSQISGGYTYSNNTEIYFNAKNVRGHNEIWSYYSEANLTVSDLTTVISDGGHDNARNTSEMTIGVAYSSEQDTFWDSSDLKVFFDQDFLLTGQENKSRAIFFLLDEQADLVGGPLLDNIDVDGIRFQVNGGPVLTIEAPEAQNGNTHAGFVAALQDSLDALIAQGLVPADTTLYVDPTITDFTFLDNGAQSSTIPAIVLQTQTSAVFTPVGFSRVEDAIGEYDVYGRFTNEVDEAELPLSVNIALEKAGSGGEGGDVIVGSNDKYNHGIDVFNVTVYGDASRPSWVDYLNSTGDSESGIGQHGELDVINITSNNVSSTITTSFPSTSTFASLVIGSTNDDLTLIDATTFKGDLTLGNVDEITNLATLLATGGGDVSFEGYIYAPNAYTYKTGAGDDVIDLNIDGDALEYDTSSLLIDTGAGADQVYVGYADQTTSGSSSSADFPNHIILRNVDINTGTGDDTVTTYGQGQFRITTGDGNDTIYSEQSGQEATWVFNVDRAQYQNTDELGGLPGVPLRYSLIDGASVTVTFSGPGSDSGGAGGGVLAEYGNNAALGDANAYTNGFEKSITIDVPASKFYGTQQDINKAIIAAIESDPVLSKLLIAYIGANNTLVVETIADGSYVVEDLDVSVTRLAGYSNSSTAVISNTLIAEAVSLGLVNTGEVAAGSTWSSLSPTLYAKLVGAALDNGFYSGINNNQALDGLVAPSTSFYNLDYSGYAGSYEADHVHTPGAGNDVVVLSTNGYNSNFTPDTLPVGTVFDSNVYATLDGWLFDLASNETIVLSGNFGSDTIVNFTTAGYDDHDTANVPVGTASGTYTSPNAGFDFLDFTSYLTSTYQPSTGDHKIAVTLEDASGGDAPNLAGLAVTADDNGLIDANEVVVISLDDNAAFGPATGSGAETFKTLTAADLAAVINNSASNGGGFASLSNAGLNTNNTYTSATGDLINGAGKAIVMIQNNDNLGEYRVFEVSWNGLASASSHTATVTDRGTLDFGTSLEGLDELNLVGSTEYSHFNFDSSYLLG